MVFTICYCGKVNFDNYNTYFHANDVNIRLWNCSDILIEGMKKSL